MKCDQVKNQLDAYISNDLKPDIKNKVGKHILECKACQEELIFIQKYSSEMASLKKIKAPNDFLEMLHKRIVNEPFYKKLIQKLFLPLTIKIPFEAAGALAIIILIVYIYGPIEPVKRIFKTAIEHDQFLAEENVKIKSQKKQPSRIAVNRSVAPSIPKKIKTAPVRTAVKKKAKSYPEIKTFEIALLITNATAKTSSRDIEYSSPSASESPYSSFDDDKQESYTSKKTEKSDELDKEIKFQKMAESVKAKKRSIKREDIAPTSSKERSTISSIDRIRNITTSLQGKILKEEDKKQINNNRVKDNRGASIQKQGEQVHQYIVVEIPVKNYRSFINELTRIGKITKGLPEKPELFQTIKMKIKISTLN